MRVLLVDDEVKLGNVLQRRMRREGIGVDVVLSGEAALTRAGATDYDAIILDLMLPGVDGFETCRRLREDGIWSPTLMLTARSAWRGEVELSLTMHEFALLEAFIRHPGQVLGRIELLEHAWDQSYQHRSNVIEVYIGYLRDKVDRPFGRQSLETVRGVGYRLREDG